MIKSKSLNCWTHGRTIKGSNLRMVTLISTRYLSCNKCNLRWPESNKAKF